MYRHGQKVQSYENAKHNGGVRTWRIKCQHTKGHLFCWEIFPYENSNTLCLPPESQSIIILSLHLVSPIVWNQNTQRTEIADGHFGLFPFSVHFSLCGKVTVRMHLLCFVYFDATPTHSNKG